MNDNQVVLVCLYQRQSYLIYTPVPPVPAPTPPPAPSASRARPAAVPARFAPSPCATSPAARVNFAP